MPHSAHPLPTPDGLSADTDTPPGSGRDQEGSFHLYSFLLGLLTSLLLVGGTLLLIRQPSPPPIVLQPPPTPMPTPAPTASPTPGPITVFVSGAVMAPGLVTLPATARAGDAITAAGGLAPGADEALVNQAQPLWDGAQVHVPAVPQAEGMGSGVALANPSPPTGVSGQGGGFTAGSLPGVAGRERSHQHQHGQRGGTGNPARCGTLKSPGHHRQPPLRQRGRSGTRPRHWCQDDGLPHRSDQRELSHFDSHDAPCYTWPNALRHSPIDFVRITTQ